MPRLQQVRAHLVNRAAPRKLDNDGLRAPIAANRFPSVPFHDDDEQMCHLFAG
jgi:hypothetical protein